MNISYSAKIEHVSREVFNRVSDRVQAVDEIKHTSMPISVYYDGTNFYGDVIIKAYNGNLEAYRKALQIFIEEYCK